MRVQGRTVFRRELQPRAKVLGLTQLQLDDRRHSPCCATASGRRDFAPAVRSDTRYRPFTGQQHSSRSTLSTSALAEGTVAEESSIFTIRGAVSDEELAAVAKIRADAFYENDRGRFVESFKKQFVRQETESLQSRTQVPAIGGRGVPRCECMVALDAHNTVVGGIDIRLPRDSSGVQPTGVPDSDSAGCYILNVVVAENQRGVGIGKLLMKAAMARAAGAWDAQRMYTHVEADNEVAYRLYKGCGFEDHSVHFNLAPASKLGQLVLLVRDTAKAGLPGSLQQAVPGSSSA